LLFLLPGLARTLQIRLGYIVCRIVCHVPFVAHASALQLDASVQRRLVQLLLPPLHAAAAAMQLPADRRPAEMGWHSLVYLTAALMSEVISSALHEQQAVANASDSCYAPRMLQTATQLFAAAPASPDDFMDARHFAFLWVSLLYLLSVACSARAISQQQHASTLPDALRQRMARQLLQALPRLPTALRWAAEHAERPA
jgi:hypothetical protein